VACRGVITQHLLQHGVLRVQWNRKCKCHLLAVANKRLLPSLKSPSVHLKLKLPQHLISHNIMSRRAQREYSDLKVNFLQDIGIQFLPCYMCDNTGITNTLFVQSLCHPVQHPPVKSCIKLYSVVIQ